MNDWDLVHEQVLKLHDLKMGAASATRTTFGEDGVVDWSAECEEQLERILRTVRRPLEILGQSLVNQGKLRRDEIGDYVQECSIRIMGLLRGRRIRGELYDPTRSRINTVMDSDITVWVVNAIRKKSPREWLLDDVGSAENSLVPTVEGDIADEVIAEMDRGALLSRVEQAGLLHLVTPMLTQSLSDHLDLAEGLPEWYSRFGVKPDDPNRCYHRREALAQLVRGDVDLGVLKLLRASSHSGEVYDRRSTWKRISAIEKGAE